MDSNNFTFEWGWDFNWAFITAPFGPMFWAVMLLNVGAVYRLSRVIARDSILDRPRNAMVENFHGPLVNLIQCMWCLSFWYALVAVFFTAWDTTHDLWLIVAAVLTLSTVTGQLSERA